MPTTKLTLSADSSLIRQAKKLAAEEGTSLSSMFSRYMQSLLSRRNGKERIGPLARQATGLAKLPADKDYKEVLTDALIEKYGL